MPQPIAGRYTQRVFKNSNPIAEYEKRFSWKRDMVA